MRNRSLASEREFTRLVVGRSMGRKLLFVFPQNNAQLHLTKRKMSSNGSANVKHSEAMSDDTASYCIAELRQWLKRDFKRFK